MSSRKHSASNTQPSRRVHLQPANLPNLSMQGGPRPSSTAGPSTSQHPDALAHMSRAQYLYPSHVLNVRSGHLSTSAAGPPAQQTPHPYAADWSQVAPHLHTQYAGQAWDQRTRLGCDPVAEQHAPPHPPGLLRHPYPLPNHSLPSTFHFDPRIAPTLHTSLGPSQRLYTAPAPVAPRVLHESVHARYVTSPAPGSNSWSQHHAQNEVCQPLEWSSANPPAANHSAHFTQLPYRQPMPPPHINALANHPRHPSSSCSGPHALFAHMQPPQHHAPSAQHGAGPSFSHSTHMYNWPNRYPS
jgi:hypothetical protein